MLPSLDGNGSMPDPPKIPPALQYSIYEPMTIFSQIQLKYSSDYKMYNGLLSTLISFVWTYSQTCIKRSPLGNGQVTA